jgi:predicted nucleic acid-binding protein
VRAALFDTCILAIIGATAQVENRLLITRNISDFRKNPGVIFPYEI